MTNTQMSFSFLIPAMNESNGIEQTINDAHKFFNENNYAYEIIVVDDGSTDDTLAIAQRCNVLVFSNPHNIGYGRSIKQGIAKSTYDTIIICDGDGTYPIFELNKLITLYQKNYDMVVGQRTGKIYRESFFKYPLRLILKILGEFTTGRSIPDINSGLRIFSKNTINPYLDHLCDTFSFTTSLTLAYMLTAKFVGYEKISYFKRMGKTKVRMFRDSLRTLQFITQAILYYNPIKLFLIIATFPLIICAMSFFGFVLLGSLNFLTISSMSLFTSILIISMGMLADLFKTK